MATPTASDTLATEGVGVTPTGKSTTDLLGWIKAWTEALPGASFASTFPPFAGAQGFTLQDVRNQLFSAGYSRTQINKIVNAKPSELQSILDQIAMSFVTLPGALPAELPAGTPAAAGAEGAAGAAAGAEGAAGGGAGAASSLASKAASSLATGASVAALLSGPIEWLSTKSNWLKVLEVIGGAVAIYLAIKSLTGIETPKISIEKAAKAAAVA